MRRPNVFGVNSRFAFLTPGWAAVNSRFETLREFSYKMLIQFNIFSEKWLMGEQNRKNSRFRREKSGICRTGENNRNSG